MNEPVRLVIWDLDETFWRGTLAEEGITHYFESRNDLIIELSKRGIMNSICSKNDHHSVKSVLETHKIWDYFVFPSINWTPKGQRILDLVAKMQLREASVLFIDDNRSNREEAKSFCPGLQLADNDLVGHMLVDPRFVGKDDSTLSRLAQYKVLEQKAADQEHNSSSNIDFLRSSNIRVTVQHDVEHDLDRAIELINRSNQLNFTKKRLADDVKLATDELKRQLAGFDVRTGLVYVNDKYGDYGCVGFFLLEGHWGQKRLVHFVFSCRILGMGIEQWVYDKLGRPNLDIVGRVLSNFDAQAPDWINRHDADDAQALPSGPHPPSVLLRGGCENEILEHYFRLHTQDVHTEFLYLKRMQIIARHNTVLLAQALVPRSDEMRSVIARIGLSEEDVASDVFSSENDRRLVVYFPAGDGGPVVSHKTLDLSLPLVFHGYGSPADPHDDDYKRNYFKDVQFNQDDVSGFETIVSSVRQEFVLEPDVVDCTRRAYDRVAANLPSNILFVIIKPNYERLSADGKLLQSEWSVQLNALIDTAFGGRANVRVVDMRTVLNDLDLVVDNEYNHFKRTVYFRLYNVISGIYREWANDPSSHSTR